VGLLTSTVASTAIIAQPPDEQLQKPERIHDNLFTSTMIKNIIGQACCQIIILSLILFQGTSLMNSGA
jgi:magnesium-transporting ATPase (P-type)